MIKYNNVSLCCSVKGLILDNLSFEIKNGEFFVLIGPSGSGKTTTLKLINRLIEQTEGDIYFQDKKLKDYNLALIPEMKKFDKKLIAEKTKDLLEKVGLNPKLYMKRYSNELSGGEKQRIGILRAIIANPKVLLMDEPFSALDPISRTQLQDLIKQLHNEYKMTTVFVTHDMDEALKLADRICILQEGKVVQIATPKEMRDNPANDFVREFFKVKGCN